jgi:hypothetical protein
MTARFSISEKGNASLQPRVSRGGRSALVSRHSDDDALLVD